MGREHHGTNCAYRADPDEPCTCGVTERTEREMHAAWRKRAEEAETALAAMTAERDALRESNIRNHRGAVVIVELTKRLTSGNAVHHARNIGTIAGAIADRSARAAVEGER